jgi:ectoine hydroxylase-related dioxygenase (phytanoyl-CoA dioxygenase family)
MVTVGDSTTLTESQKRSLKRNGFLVLRDAIGEELCAAARDAVWEVVPEDWDGPDPRTCFGKWPSWRGRSGVQNSRRPS